MRAKRHTMPGGQNRASRSARLLPSRLSRSFALRGAAKAGRWSIALPFVAAAGLASIGGTPLALRWAGIVSLVYLTANLLKVALGSFRDETRPADCAIVLGASVRQDGMPSRTLRARAVHAGAVYHAGHVRHLVLSGGLGAHPPSEAQAMRAVLIEHGVPAEAMVLEEAATSTADSARYCAAILRGRGWRTALLVSDAWHLPRAARLFRQQGVRVFPCPAFNSPGWTQRRSRLRYTLREAVCLCVQRVHSR